MKEQSNYIQIKELIDRTSTEITIGGKSSRQLEKELVANGIRVSRYAREMMHSKAFTTLAEPMKIRTVELTAEDFGFTHEPTTEQLYKEAVLRMGLKLAPEELGPYARLQDTK